jgi:ssDNA-binding Zn-finger/Zn-ribbon topoisomerase 1
MEVGQQEINAVAITRNKKQMVPGTCPICNGGDPKIIKSSVTQKRFVRCPNYAAGTFILPLHPH